MFYELQATGIFHKVERTTSVYILNCQLPKTQINSKLPILKPQYDIGNSIDLYNANASATIDWKWQFLTVHHDTCNLYRYIYNIIANAPMGISNMIGPMEISVLYIRCTLGE